MGSVDIGDQLRASYNWDRRTRRGGWRAVAFLFLLEICVTYSWQLWRQQKNYKGTHLDFRQTLYREYFMKFSKVTTLKSQAVSLPLTFPTKMATGYSMIRRSRRGWCGFCSSSRKKSISTMEYSRGQNERKAKTLFGCKECNVPLCKDTGCWNQWHAGIRSIEK